MVSVYNLSKTKQNDIVKHNSSKEIEFKWQARSKKDFERFRRHAKALGAIASRSQTLLIRDLYLDTAGGIFTNAGLKCRLRQAGSEWRLTLKSFGQRKKGLVQRLEKEIKLPSFKSRTAALRYVSGRLKPSLLAGAPLKSLFEIRNRRTLCRYQLPGRAKAEASFDRVTISRDKRKVRMLEIEFEFLGGNLASFKKFSAELGLAAGLCLQKKSKVATAVSAFGLGRILKNARIDSARHFIKYSKHLSALL